MNPGEQQRQRALAGAARAHHCESRSRRRREVDPVENVVTLAVGVVDVARDQLLVDRDVDRSSGRGGTSLDPDDPRQRSRSQLHLVLPREQGVDRNDELLRVEGRRRDGSRRKAAVDVEESADDHAEDQRHHVAELARTEEHGPEPQSPALPADPLPDVVVGLLDPCRTESERFDRPSRCHRLLDHRVDPGECRCLVLVRRAGPLQVPACPDRR